MKIIIIGPPRTGSTSLSTALSKSLNLKIVNMPGSYQYPNNFSLIEHIINTDNIIFRTDTKVNHGFVIEDFINFFDYTILLSRRNEDDHKISFANLYYKHFYTHIRNHEIYTKQEIPTSIYQSKHFEKCYNDNILIEKESIKELSKNKDIPTIFYEDLYESLDGYKLITNLISELDSDKFFNFISSTKKIRFNIEKKII